MAPAGAVTNAPERAASPAALPSAELPAVAPTALPPSLTYASDTAPGIRRVRKGKGFSYRDPKGQSVTEAATLARIRKLAIPPAWTDVWISPDPAGHIQATGRDARGRKQYRYHSGWTEHRDRDKYDHILAFARMLPRIRDRIAEDMGKRGAVREKVLATVVHLLDRTLIRVGNPEYAKENGSFGLTTLRNRHVAVEGAELRFDFKGKSGKTWRLQVKDRRIARIARSLQELPGQQLFQYLGDEGEVRSVTSDDVNAYLREIAGPDVSAKDFRTWAGTVLAAIALGAAGPFASPTEAKRKIKQAIAAVAQKLGNTPTICRKCYVHPEVVTTIWKAASRVSR
jgi:DNA topoisomerase-1